MSNRPRSEAGLQMKSIDGALVKRNHKQEELAAQGALFDDLQDYRFQRHSGVVPALVQIAHALIICGLPYRQTESRQHVRRSRKADGTTITVTFHALGTDVAMPYGTDRTLLHWLIDQAIKRKDPFVPWSTASQFMEDMGYSRGGKNYQRVRDSFKRLSSVAIVVEQQDAAFEDIAIMPIIQGARLPRSVAPKFVEFPGTPATQGVRFGEAFFEEINRNHVPFPWEILRALDRKPQMQDYILFLHWRSFSANRPSLIPWAALREQLWQDDKTSSRIRVRFADAIRMLKTVWPEFQGDARSDGLWIAPPRGNRHLITGAVHTPRSTKTLS